MARPADREAVERVAEPGDRLGAVGAVRAQLGDHRVVEHRDLAAFDHAGIDPDAGTLGLEVVDQAAGRRQEAARRILGIDARLDRPAVAPDVALLEAEPLAGGDPDHLLDQIEAGDQLGHRVLHLEPGVHLQEEEVARLVGDELDRAGRVVVHGARERLGLLAHRRARRLVEQRARRFLDHLLMAALDRAFALAERHDVAVPVAEDLDLDVPRIADELLEEHPIVAERGARFALRAGKTFREVALVQRHAHALAAAAGRRLDHHRIADHGGDAGRVLGVVDRVQVPRDGADARRLGQALGRDLVAHQTRSPRPAGR